MILSMTVVLKPEHASKSPGRLIKTQISGYLSRISDSAGLGQGWRILISTEFLVGDATTAFLGITLEESYGMSWRPEAHLHVLLFITLRTYVQPWGVAAAVRFSSDFREVSRVKFQEYAHPLIHSFSRVNLTFKIMHYVLKQRYPQFSNIIVDNSLRDNSIQTMWTCFEIHGDVCTLLRVWVLAETQVQIRCLCRLSS